MKNVKFFFGNHGHSALCTVEERDHPAWHPDDVFFCLYQGCPVLSIKGRCECRFSLQPGSSHTSFHLLNYSSRAFNRLGFGFCLVGIKKNLHPHRATPNKTGHVETITNCILHVYEYHVFKVVLVLNCQSLKTFGASWKEKIWQNRPQIVKQLKFYMRQTFQFQQLVSPVPKHLQSVVGRKVMLAPE